MPGLRHARGVSAVAGKSSTVARGYGYEHRKRRRLLEPVVAAGQAVCGRCGGPILPGQRWDLDHTDDRVGYRGTAHRFCNQAAGGRKAGRNRRHRAAVVRLVAGRQW